VLLWSTVETCSLGGARGDRDVVLRGFSFYTIWLKPRSPQNIVIVGAGHPRRGYRVALFRRLGPAVNRQPRCSSAWASSAIVFCWNSPPAPFWALSPSRTSTTLHCPAGHSDAPGPPRGIPTAVAPQIVVYSFRGRRRPPFVLPFVTERGRRGLLVTPRCSGLLFIGQAIRLGAPNTTPAQAIRFFCFQPKLRTLPPRFLSSASLPVDTLLRTRLEPLVLTAKPPGPVPRRRARILAGIAIGPSFSPGSAWSPGSCQPGSDERRPSSSGRHPPTAGPREAHAFGGTAAPELAPSNTFTGKVGEPVRTYAGPARWCATSGLRYCISVPGRSSHCCPGQLANAPRGEFGCFGVDAQGQRVYAEAVFREGQEGPPWPIVGGRRTTASQAYGIVRYRQPFVHQARRQRSRLRYSAGDFPTQIGPAAKSRRS